jgi:hypothetical protein
MMEKIEKITKNKKSLERIFPPIEKLDLDNISFDATLVAPAGFEDRCFSFLDKLIDSNKKVTNVIGIEYEPFNPKNRKVEFEEKGKKISLKDKTEWITYDRFNPEDFYGDFRKIKGLVNETADVIIDVSGMSKYLIIILLDILKDFDKNVIVTYSEADIYHPTKEEFESKKRESPEVIPTFLTKGIYDVVLTTSLSSITMQNAPLLMIAFPSFNYKELTALLNEMTPQYLIEIEGIPHEKHNRWRYNAIRWINKKIPKDFKPKIQIIKHEELTTFDYIETVSVLDNIYKEFRYTHKCIIAPTGSKLQSIGVFFFKQLHSDVQVVYPAAEKFAKEYTEECRHMWMIKFPKFHSYIRILENYYKDKLISLKKLLDSPF